MSNSIDPYWPYQRRHLWYSYLATCFVLAITAVVKGGFIGFVYYGLADNEPLALVDWAEPGRILISSFLLVLSLVTIYQYVRAVAVLKQPMRNTTTLFRNTTYWAIIGAAAIGLFCWPVTDTRHIARYVPPVTAVAIFIAVTWFFSRTLRNTYRP